MSRASWRLIVDSECIGMWRGYGAHSCKEIALTRALCEAAQTRALLLACARDDILWKRHLKLISDSRAHNWIEVIDKEKPTVKFADVSSLEGSVFDRMTEVGRRVLVVDFPLPEDAPFCVVQGARAWSGIVLAELFRTGTIHENRLSSSVQHFRKRLSRNLFQTPFCLGQQHKGTLTLQSGN